MTAGPGYESTDQENQTLITSKPVEKRYVTFGALATLAILAVAGFGVSSHVKRQGELTKLTGQVQSLAGVVERMTAHKQAVRKMAVRKMQAPGDGYMTYFKNGCADMSEYLKSIGAYEYDPMACKGDWCDDNMKPCFDPSKMDSPMPGGDMPKPDDQPPPPECLKCIGECAYVKDMCKIGTEYKTLMDAVGKGACKEETLSEEVLQLNCAECGDKCNEGGDDDDDDDDEPADMELCKDCLNTALCPITQAACFCPTCTFGEGDCKKDAVMEECGETCAASCAPPTELPAMSPMGSPSGTDMPVMGGGGTDMPVMGGDGTDMPVMGGGGAIGTNTCDCGDGTFTCACTGLPMASHAKKQQGPIGTNTCDCGDGTFTCACTGLPMASHAKKQQGPMMQQAPIYTNTCACGDGTFTCACTGLPMASHAKKWFA